MKEYVLSLKEKTPTTLAFILSNCLKVLLWLTHWFLTISVF